MMTLFDPPARASDPDTSHQAAAVAKRGNDAMIHAILWAMPPRHVGALTAFDIAEVVERKWPGRWDEGGIRSCVSRLGKRGLLVKDGKGKSPRKQPCDRWRLP